MSYLIIYPNLEIVETDNPTIEDLENANNRKCKIVEVDFNSKLILILEDGNFTEIE